MTTPCAHCGKPFEPRNSRARYCGDECARAAERAKRSQQRDTLNAYAREWRAARRARTPVKQAACARCGEQFELRTNARYCPDCRQAVKIELDRRYYLANREKIDAQNKAWAAAHPDRVAALGRQWREANRDRKAASDRAWAAAHPDRKAAAKRKYHEAHAGEDHDYLRTGQAETLAQARRRGYMWTGPELELVSRDDLTAKQVALMTGRTLCAVYMMRSRLRDDPRKIFLAGLDDPADAMTGAGMSFGPVPL